jgi:hypothetical protein
MNVVKFKGVLRPKQERSALSTFTGQRLDWEKCLRFDRRILPFPYEVACAIASHARPDGTAYVSDETLADEVGSGPRQFAARGFPCVSSVG